VQKGFVEFFDGSGLIGMGFFINLECALEKQKISSRIEKCFTV